jgi:hypothetical protein
MQVDASGNEWRQYAASSSKCQQVATSVNRWQQVATSRNESHHWQQMAGFSKGRVLSEHCHLHAQHNVVLIYGYDVEQERAIPHNAADDHDFGRFLLRFCMLRQLHKCIVGCIGRCIWSNCSGCTACRLCAQIPRLDTTEYRLLVRPRFLQDLLFLIKF